MFRLASRKGLCRRYIDNKNPLSLGLGRSGTRFAACSSLPSAGVLKRFLLSIYLRLRMPPGGCSALRLLIVG